MQMSDGAELLLSEMSTASDSLSFTVAEPDAAGSRRHQPPESGEGQSRPRRVQHARVPWDEGVRDIDDESRGKHPHGIVDGVERVRVCSSPCSEITRESEIVAWLRGLSEVWRWSA